MSSEGPEGEGIDLGRVKAKVMTAIKSDVALHQGPIVICPYCDEPLLPGEIADFWTSTAHHECQARSLLGSVAHIEGRCGCFVPGADETDPPGMTKREAAKAAWQAHVKKNSEMQRHLAWCKARALQCVAAGDLSAAYQSMASDLNKHPATANHPAIQLGFQLLLIGDLDTPEKMREFIEGFN